MLLEYDKFYLLNVYVPNAQPELKRLEYRMQWEDDLRAIVSELAKKKHVVMCGDLNVAHEEIDLRTLRQTAETQASLMKKEQR